MRITYKTGIKIFMNVVFFIAISCESLVAQKDYKATLYGQNFNAGSYIEYIRILEDNQSEIIGSNQSKTPLFPDGLYYQVLALYYSYVGETQKAEKLMSKVIGGINTNVVDIEEYKKIKVSQEFDVIKKEMSRSKIVMINEAHHQPHHRIFTYNSLEVLYKEGFRYLLLEGINSSEESLLNQRGYPVLDKMRSCSYPEPLYGNMVRRALNLGFKIIAYDYGSGNCEYAEAQPFYCVNKRELFACRNIQKVLSQDSSAKIVIHCGYDHIKEKTDDDQVTLGEVIKIMTSIDPFTINQTEMRERGNEKSEHHEYQYLKSNVKFDKTSFLTDTLSWFWFLPGRKGHFDAYLIHPPVSLNKYSRPTYLDEMNNVSKYIFIPNKIYGKTEDGYLVQAFSSSEINGMPLDQFIIKNMNDNYALYLPKGKYSICFRNKKGELVYKIEIVI